MSEDVRQLIRDFEIIDLSCPPKEPKPRDSDPKAPEGHPKFSTLESLILSVEAPCYVDMEVEVSGKGPFRFEWFWTSLSQPLLQIPQESDGETLSIYAQTTEASGVYRCRVSNSLCPEGRLSRRFLLKVHNYEHIPLPEQAGEIQGDPGSNSNRPGDNEYSPPR